MQEDKVYLLVKIILDPEAEDHEKDDAAIDLADFDDDMALQALIKTAQAPHKTDEFALDNYGETIGKMWIRRGCFPVETYYSLKANARAGVCVVLRSNKPQWIKQYGLDNDSFKDNDGV